jgi:Immunomodulating metalloprotease N-terminal domain
MIFSISYNRRFLAFCTAVLFTAAANATLNEAIITGNPALLPADSTETLNAALQQIDTYQSVQSSKLAAFYPSPGAITYAPGNRTQLITIEENEAVFPLLIGNKGNILAVNGSAGGGRFAAYGSVPMSYFLSGNNLSYEAPFKRVLGWLFSGVPSDIASFSQAKNIALTYTGGENTKITQWLNQKAATWKTQVCNDPATISACYQNKDLLIVSWETNANASANVAVLSAIKTHLALKKPVLYLHTWYEATSSFSDLLTKFFGISLPRWKLLGE